MTWPYGDRVPGNYLAKTCMPVLCVLVASSASSRLNLSLPSFLLLTFSLITSVLTGERLNLFLRCASAGLASLTWKPKVFRILIFLVAVGTVLVILGSYFPWFGTRYITDFIQDLPINRDSPYLRVWLGGVEAFFTSPIIGIGPDNYRMLCTQITEGLSGIDCHTHPHNYFIQVGERDWLVRVAYGNNYDVLNGC